MPASIMLQDWTVVSGQDYEMVVTMPSERWADLGGYVDVMFFTEISSYSDGYGGVIALQTSPTRDESLFKTMATVTFQQSPPAVSIVRFASASVPLSRWVRWQVSAPSATTNRWDVAFRVWMTVRPG